MLVFLERVSYLKKLTMATAGTQIYQSPRLPDGFHKGWKAKRPAGPQGQQLYSVLHSPAAGGEGCEGASPTKSLHKGCQGVSPTKSLHKGCEGQPDEIP